MKYSHPVRSATLLDRLRERGWRLTSQRRAVAEVLTGEHVHLTADEVHEAARRALPELSLATVYNTLNELVAMGEVREVRALPGPARYDPNNTVAHHHLVCVHCGLLFDVNPPDADRLRLPRGQRHGFDIDTVSVTFEGRCPACR